MPRNVANNFNSLWKSALTSIEILFLFSAICNTSLFLSDAKSCFPHIRHVFEVQKNIDFLSVLGQLLILNSAIFFGNFVKKVFSLIYRTFSGFKKVLSLPKIYSNFFFDFHTFLRKFWYQKLFFSYTTRIWHCEKHRFLQGFKTTFFLTFVLFDGTFVQPKINPLI